MKKTFSAHTGVSAEPSDDEDDVLVISESSDPASSASLDEVAVESDDDCVVLVPKWEARHTSGDGNCFFHALGEPAGDTYQLDGVLGKKQAIVTALNDLLDRINSPDVSNDALLAYAYYEQMMVTLVSEYRLSQSGGHGMSPYYRDAITSIIESIEIQHKAVELYRFEDQLEQVTHTLKAAIKTWKGPDHHARIDEDLNRYIDDLSSEVDHGSAECRDAKETLGYLQSCRIGVFRYV